MNHLRRTSIILTLCTIAAALIAWHNPTQNEPQPAKPVADITHLAWLAGVWVTENPGVRSEEHWMSPRGNSMIGMNRTIAKSPKKDATAEAGKGSERTAFFEFLRIETTPDGGIVYLASPRGRQPATSFKMIELTESKVVFENPEHDFPQRIIYQRDGDTLNARIEGTQTPGGELHEQKWSWTREKSQ